MENKKERSFEQKMRLSSLLCNFCAVVVYLFYSFIFAKITVMQFLESLVLGSILLAVMQFIVGPFFSNRVYTRKVSLEIEYWKEHGLDVLGRTQLLAKLMKRPLYKGIEVFFIYVISGVIFCSWFKIRLHVSTAIELGVIIAMLFASFVDGVLSVYISEKICSKYATELVKEGVDDTFVMKNKFFGLSIGTIYAITIFAPVIFTNILTGLYIYHSVFLNQNTNSEAFSLFSMIAIPTFNALISITMSIFFAKQLARYIRNMQNATLSIDQSNITKANPIPTDLSNEISFNVYLINKTVGLFKNILEKTSDVSLQIIESTQTLESLSSETASTALEQSTGVREIVSTMEDADKLFKNIEGKVSDVTLVANKTANEVLTGISSLSENMQKMIQITESNMETISGIKALSEKIDSIWEIVTIINNIADQTKIIAFNAELEATSAGEAGKNFHIVANEIRRLADGTMDSTREIKEKITEIQHSSDNLIITSEGGTEKIHEGSELTELVNENFKSIKEAAEITVESAQDIQVIVLQQTAAFEQIVITLKQISAGSENFSASTQTIRGAVEKLQQLADKMENIVSN